MTALLPLPFIRLGLLAVSMLARFIVHKFRFGMPSAAEACYTPVHRARMKLHGSLE